jgi:hypothetical protein
VRVQQALSAGGLIEHGFAHVIVFAVAAEPLLRTIVDAGCPKGAQQKPECANDLVGGAVRKAPDRLLPEGIMVVDEGDQIPPDLTAV